MLCHVFVFIYVKLFSNFLCIFLCDHLWMFCVISMFLQYFLVLVYNFISLWFKGMLCIIFTLLKVFRFIFGLSWKMLHVHARKMYILLFWSGLFYRYLLSTVGLYCHSSNLFSCWFHVSLFYPLLNVVYESFPLILSIFASGLLGLCC